ncbi:unnamed protein product, partial [Heterosigma akashiwo]
VLSVSDPKRASQILLSKGSHEDVPASSSTRSADLRKLHGSFPISKPELKRANAHAHRGGPDVGHRRPGPGVRQ